MSNHNPDTGIHGSCCSGEGSAQERTEVESCCGTEERTAAHDHCEASSSTSAIRDTCCTPKASHSNSCCAEDEIPEGQQRPLDKLLWGSALLVGAGYIAYLSGVTVNGPVWLHHYAEGSFELMNAMWWGLAIGILFVGLLARLPRETVVGLIGEGGTFNGLLCATAAGVLLDLCSHGILAVGMKLYERGASIGQVMAFLIASPWNSLSLTLILFALIGAGWTLAFIGLSLVIALVSGWIFEKLVARGALPENPHRAQLSGEKGPSLWQVIKQARWSVSGLVAMLKEGVKGARMVIRWALFGVVLAALIRALVPADFFADWFGPTMVGLLLTVIAATIIEVCSEGSVPIAADLLTRAAAPGNAFTFLMAGVATDYTEVMVLRDTTRSWKIALALPLVTVPQVLVLGFILNQF